MNTDDKIAVCSRSFSRHPDLREELLNSFRHVKFNDEGKSLKGDELVSFLSGCDGAVIALETIDEEILKQLPQLKFIGKYGVGLDKLDFSAMDKFNVQLGWTPGVNAQAVAELTLALALNIVREIPQANEVAKDGLWTQIKGKQISSMTYGVIGCGHTGKALVKLLSAFGCRIMAYDIEDYSEFYYEYRVEAVSLNELLETSDVISLHVPKNQTTEHMIDHEKISLIKNGAYFINTARGGLVDESALICALDRGQLTGAAFDVLEEEPPVDLSLIEHPKVYVTPHIAGSSEEAILAMGQAAIKGLSEYRNASYFEKYK